MTIRRLNNINVLNAVTLSLRLVRNPSEKKRFPTSGNDKKCKNNKCVCINTGAFNSDTVLPPLPNGEMDGMRGILKVIL
jgi:hypothetical protein